jgi:hypothetical protein
MRYEVHVAAHSGGQPTRFKHKSEDQLKEGDPIQVPGMTYRVMHVRPLDPSESDEFDAVVEAEWVAGPAQSEYLPG